MNYRDHIQQLQEALGALSGRLGQTAYLEYRENMRLCGFPVPELWGSLSAEGKTVWENVALATIHDFLPMLPGLVRAAK